MLITWIRDETEISCSKGDRNEASNNDSGQIMILLMEKILHKLIGSLSVYPIIQRFFTSQVVVWDF